MIVFNKYSISLFENVELYVVIGLIYGQLMQPSCSDEDGDKSDEEENEDEYEDTVEQGVSQKQFGKKTKMFIPPRLPFFYGFLCPKKVVKLALQGTVG